MGAAGAEQEPKLVGLEISVEHRKVGLWRRTRNIKCVGGWDEEMKSLVLNPIWRSKLEIIRKTAPFLENTIKI